MSLASFDAQSQIRLGALKSSKELCQQIKDPSVGFSPQVVGAIFVHFDPDGMGYLDRKASIKLFTKIVKYNPKWTKAHFSEWFAVLDPKGTGRLYRDKITTTAVAQFRKTSTKAHRRSDTADVLVGAQRSSRDLICAIQDPSMGFKANLIPGIFTHFDKAMYGYLDHKSAIHFFQKIVKHSNGRWTKAHFSEWFSVLDPMGEGKLRRENMTIQAVALARKRGAKMSLSRPTSGAVLLERADTKAVLMGAAKSSKEICEAIGDPSFGFDETLIPGIFAHFDTGPNGYLNRPDATRFFKKIVKHSGGLWTEMDFPRWFVALDPDGEGKLRRANISKRAVAAKAQNAMQLDNTSSVLEPSLTRPERPPTPPPPPRRVLRERIDSKQTEASHDQKTKHERVPETSDGRPIDDFWM